jgi:hypothetical protein
MQLCSYAVTSDLADPADLADRFMLSGLFFSQIYADFADDQKLILIWLTEFNEVSLRPLTTR